ncbi:MAG: hypothetical protein R6V00_09325 [Candidatus Aminicenantes bacterium]
MNHPAMNITGLGRPLDFKYPGNWDIFFLTLAVTIFGIGFQLIWGPGGIQAVLWGLGAGLSIFLTWAIGRELDPDHIISDFIAAGLTLIGLFIWGIPSLIFLFWLLLAVRILNRTTGKAATILDSLGLIALGAWLSYQGSWIAGLLSAVVLFSDSLLPQGKKRQIFLAVVSLGASSAALIFGKGIGSRMNISWEAAVTPLLAAVVFFPVVIQSRHIRSLMDQTGERMIPARVQAGQVLALAFWLLISFWRGFPGLISTLPVGAAALGAGIFHLIRILKSR